MMNITEQKIRDRFELINSESEDFVRNEMRESTEEQINAVLKKYFIFIESIGLVNDVMSHEKFNVICGCCDLRTARFIWDDASLENSAQYMIHERMLLIGKSRNIS